jgi:hypothetical protein
MEAVAARSKEQTKVPEMPDVAAKLADWFAPKK